MATLLSFMRIREFSSGAKITKIHEIGMLIVCDTAMAKNDPRCVLFPLYNLISCMMTKTNYCLFEMLILYQFYPNKNNEKWKSASLLPVANIIERFYDELPIYVIKIY